MHSAPDTTHFAPFSSYPCFKLHTFQYDSFLLVNVTLWFEWKSLNRKYCLILEWSWTETSHNPAQDLLILVYVFPLPCHVVCFMFPPVPCLWNLVLPCVSFFFFAPCVCFLGLLPVFHVPSLSLVPLFTPVSLLPGMFHCSLPTFVLFSPVYLNPLF